MKNYFSKESINEYKKIYKEKGFKALLKKLGWKIFLFVFLYYLIRDIFLYIIAPIFLFDFLSKYGFSKISIYAIFLLVFVLFITFLIHSFNKNLKIKILRIASFLGFVAVILGAFGAHALKEVLVENNDVYKTASLYHFLVVFLMLFIGLGHKLISQKYQKIAFVSALLGVFLFSGSLYFLSITNLKWIGAITPVGGILIALTFIILVLGYKSKE